MQPSTLSNRTQPRSRLPALPLTPRVEHHPEVLQPAAKAPTRPRALTANALCRSAQWRSCHCGALGQSHIDHERRCCGRRRDRLAMPPLGAHGGSALSMWCDRHGQAPPSRQSTIVSAVALHGGLQTAGARRLPPPFVGAMMHARRGLPRPSRAMAARPEHPLAVLHVWRERLGRLTHPRLRAIAQSARRVCTVSAVRSLMCEWSRHGNTHTIM